MIDLCDQAKLLRQSVVRERNHFWAGVVVGFSVATILFVFVFLYLNPIPTP